MSYLIAPASTSQSVTIQIVDDSGLAVTGLVAATFPSVTYKKSGASAAVSITLADLAAITTAYASGGVKEISGGFYRLDLPDAALSTATRLTIIGDASGKHLIAPPIDVQYASANVSQWNGTAIPGVDTAGYPKVTVKNGTGTGEVSLSSGGVKVASVGGRPTRQ